MEENTDMNVENFNEEIQDLHPMEKIPLDELFKLSRREVGELKSYIDELEYKIKDLEKDIEEKEKLSHEDKKELKKDKFYQEIKVQSQQKDLAIKELKRQNDFLLYAKLENCRKCLAKKQ